MCGIFGVLQHGSDRPPDERRLEASAGLMRHRGPDHQEVYAGAAIGLAHTRLSLLDLHPRSDQPFWDSGGRYALVYNGEIYNHRELRGELEKQGVEFKTSGDTEVLLECLIRQDVEAVLPRLEGMFAFALYDSHEGSLIVARDRFGIKPLFVYDQADCFIFASEIAAMRPWIRFEPDLLSISAYLQGQSGPARGVSFFKHIKILAPGTAVTVRRGGRPRYRGFFSLGDFWDAGEVERLERLNPIQAVDEVEETLLQSVKTQLAADAPVGALCSGGVDSSLIVAMASRFQKDLAIFHADVTGPESEQSAAAALATHLRLELKTVKIADHHAVEMMPEVMAHYGHPFTLNPHAVPFLMVSRLARSHGVKAVLTGEGSDECYIGYGATILGLQDLMIRLPLRAYTGVPDWLRLLQRGQYRALIREIMTLRLKPSGVYEPAASVSVSSLQFRLERELEYDEIRSHIQGVTGKLAGYKEMTSMVRMSYLLRTLLHRNDALGMAASIESRFPFLDSRLVKLAINMPYRFKVRFSPRLIDREHPFLRDKWVLRKVADRYLPAKLAQRRKRGFPTTAHARMNIPSEFFENSFLADLFELDRRATRYLIEHADRRFKKRLLDLEVWAHVCLHDAPRTEILAKLKKHITVRPASG